MSYNSPFRNIATIRLGDFIERSTTNNHNLGNPAQRKNNQKDEKGV